MVQTQHADVLQGQEGAGRDAADPAVAGVQLAHVAQVGPVVQPLQPRVVKVQHQRNVQQHGHGSRQLRQVLTQRAVHRHVSVAVLDQVAHAALGAAPQQGTGFVVRQRDQRRPLDVGWLIAGHVLVVQVGLIRASGGRSPGQAEPVLVSGPVQVPHRL